LVLGYLLPSPSADWILLWRLMHAFVYLLLDS
jgi:hypothetical protein